MTLVYWLEQVKALLAQTSPINIMNFIATIIGYLTIFIQAGRALYTFYNTHIDWKRAEEKRINSLRPGISIEKFREMLGTPLSRRTSDVDYIEYVFQQRGYWIQAITNKDDTVVLYAVTSADQRFKPRLKHNPASEYIRLRQTTFKAAAGKTEPRLRYFISGATANSYLLEEVCLGNPSHYQTVLWGYNDACTNVWADDNVMRDLYEYLSSSALTPSIHDTLINKFRTQNTFNTFAVTAPLADVDEVLRAFPTIGVDRIWIRTFSNN